MTGQINVNKIAARTGNTITVESGDVLQAPGHVVQVQSTATALFTSTGSTTLADLLTISFTPKFSTSQLRIDVCFRYQENTTNTNCKYRVLHDSTNIYGIQNYSDYHDAAGNTITSKEFHCMVAAGSTSARTIQFQIAKWQAGGNLTINVNGDTNTESRMTVMEIAQ